MFCQVLYLQILLYRKVSRKTFQSLKKVLAKTMKSIYNKLVGGFKTARQAEIAQLVEHFTRNEGVVGSNPIFSFI